MADARRNVAALRSEIAALESRTELHGLLTRAVDYLFSDPQSALTKCRIVLEKILVAYYFQNFRRSDRRMLGHLLLHKEFRSKIPESILPRVEFVKNIGNVATHGQSVAFNDAYDSIWHLIDIVGWYLSVGTSNPVGIEGGEKIEILPALKLKFGGHLRPNIFSVAVHQNKESCCLEITSESDHGELVHRIDLDSIDTVSDPEEDDYPLTRSISRNAHILIHEVCATALVLCTDLFTEEGATELFGSDL